MIIDRKRYKGLQTYKEKGKDSYLLIDQNNNWFDSQGILTFGGKGSVIDLEISSIGDISPSGSYLVQDCYPVSWAKVPERWQNKFREYI
jgi:hypothetical protein